MNAGEKRKTCDEVCICFIIGIKHVSDFDVETKSLAPQELPRAVHTWIKPPAGYVKINFDSAFYAASGEGAWGCVARSESDQGEFIAG